ncbi:ABC transporter permease [Virgibacillus salexigens]|uniref:Inner membrane ABC transporter permease protein YdcV n=2 Tax=Virgibacillus TaxID=84406 RepID=A0A024Q7R2_9BACI|nr:MULTISPECIES: ABC transporter permease [Virgibacillus]MYL40627.1 ABC transporter permease subunit [Virgibacillus massiliensis]GGJ73347.1 spermidine/putrescine ABC transporter permease [Virgibacillus kapii]CDQ38568.1 Inner membrane ABC transporter permease protein YdcV [Virgibacillus massiliensis]
MREGTKKTLFVFTILVFAFFYIPILVLMVFSFNDSKIGTVWTGFTFDWYIRLFSNSQIIDAAFNSLFIAIVTTVISTVLGTLAALTLHRYGFPGKRTVGFVFYIPVVIPDIVLAVALLVLYSFLNVKLGLATVIPGHVVFATSFVILVLLARLAGLDKALEEAAKDLGANEWHTFWKVTFPLIYPGILAGALLAFTISLDEFVVAFFTTGPGSNTLPVLVYSMVRRGVSPEINALSTILILAVVLVIVIVGWRMNRMNKQQGGI